MSSSLENAFLLLHHPVWLCSELLLSRAPALVLPSPHASSKQLSPAPLHHDSSVVATTQSCTGNWSASRPLMGLTGFAAPPSALPPPASQGRNLHSVSMTACCSLLTWLVTTCGNGCSVPEMMVLGCLVCVRGVWGLALQISLLPVLLVGFLVLPLLHLLRQCCCSYSLGQLLVLRHLLVVL